MNIPSVRRPYFLAVASVVLLLVLLEGFLRLSPAPLAVELRREIHKAATFSTVAHPYVGHLNRPDDRSDPYGFRNDWPWPDNPDVITLGDSITLGSDVERPWPAYLARALPDGSIVNLAVGAAGPQQYSRVFETFGLKLRAKVVLIGFFARNDFRDAAMFEQWLRSDVRGNYLVWRNAGRPATVSLSLRQPTRKLVRSALWRGELITSKTYLGTALRRATGDPRAWSRTGVEVYESPGGTPIELQPEDFFRSTRAAQPGKVIFERVLAAVRRIDSLARQSGGKAAVVFVPSKEEVYLPLMRGSSPDSAAPLRAALQAHGIPVLDLLHEFRRRAADGDELFRPKHSQLPNARGQVLIAELVLSHLQQHAEFYGLSRGRRARARNVEAVTLNP